MPSRTVLTVAGLLAVVMIVVAVAQAGQANDIYNIHALVSDDPATTPAAAKDASLVNGWGLVAGPTTPWWTSNNGTDTSTLYNGAGGKAPLTVAVDGGPTGIVFNGSTATFMISQNGKAAASRFLFATESGTIAGWSPSVDTSAALVAADRSSSGAIYKGLAIADDELFATDFHNGRVDVFDSSFHLVTTAGAFKDSKIAKGFAPFGVAAIGGDIFVTFAKQDTAAKDDEPVPGQAYVDEFTPDGTLVARVVNSGKKNAPLNAPWGLAMAPSSFAPFGGDLLVGNFGDGRISAYTKRANGWVFKGQLRLADGTPIAIPGLWGIAFGNDSAAGPSSTLYFVSGPSDEAHGLFGSITTG